MDNITEVLDQEKQRLAKRLEEIAEKRTALDQEEGAVRIELASIQAFFDTKMGKVTERQVTNEKPKKERGSRGPRGPRTGPSVKDQVLAIITIEGVSKQDIIAKLGAMDNKSMQNGISNALVQLKKDGKVESGERGSYKLPGAPAGAVPPEQKETKPKRVPKTEA